LAISVHADIRTAILMRKFIDRFPRIALVASFFLFVVCLFNNGYHIEGPHSGSGLPGWSLLLIGWVGVFSQSPAWLANPALLVAWILLLKRQPAISLIAALMAIALAMTFLFQKTVVSSEAPTFSRITGYGVGYWLWLSSAAVQMLGSAVAVLSSRYLASIKSRSDSMTN
jgi:hypothetical protein